MPLIFNNLTTICLNMALSAWILLAVCAKTSGFRDWYFSSDLGKFLTRSLSIFHVPFSLSKPGHLLMHMFMCLVVVTINKSQFPVSLYVPVFYWKLSHFLGEFDIVHLFAPFLVILLNYLYKVYFPDSVQFKMVLVNSFLVLIF